MSADPRVGTEVAGHRIEAVIGRGGSSVVCLAEHVRLGRKVALKLLDPELSKDQGFRERFMRESRAAAELDHPNIVTVYDAGETDGMLYLSMRHVEGTDLSRFLRDEGRLAPLRTVEIVSQIASALDAAHARGLVHRDVKPANILIEEGAVGQERAFLSDFGITKRVRSQSGVTRSGEFVGTVDYVAPEQILGEPVDGRADVYSLGCVAFECLAGEPPFRRETDVAVIYAHLDDPPPRLSERRPDLPPGLDGVLARAMAKSKSDRYPTCGELAAALRAAVGVRPGAVPQRSDRARSRAARRRAAVAVVGVMVLAGVSIAGVVSRRREGATLTPTPPPSSSPSPGLVVTEVPRDVPVFGGPGDQAILRATVTDSGIVAVGYRASGTGGFDAAAWTSPDGVDWQLVESPAFVGPGNQLARGIASLGSLLVAVGSDRKLGESDAAVWVSGDGGRTWSQVHTGLAAPGDQVMRRVVNTGSGLVAVGYDTLLGDSDAAVWTSPDGTNWTKETAGPFGGPGDQEARTVAASGDKLVIAGSSTLNGNEDAAVWILENGTWSRVGKHSLGGQGEQAVDDVIAGGPGFIAVGKDSSGGDSNGAIWVSTSGRYWRRVGTGGVLGGPGDQEIFTIARGGPGFVAVGTDTEGGEVNAWVWTSPDGIKWTHVSPTSLAPLIDIGRQVVTDLFPFRDGLIAVGKEGRGIHDDADVWIAKPGGS